MRTHLVRIVAAAAVLLFASTGRAQYDQYSSAALDGFRDGQSLVVLNWAPSKPIGSFSSDYISDWSLRSFEVELRRKIQQNVSVGLSFSFGRWDETFSDVTVDLPGGNGVIGGPLYRYMDQFAIRALGHYYLTSGPIQPYVGVGIGGVWSYAFQQVADLSKTADGFFFIVDPEAGVLVQLMRGRTSLDLNLAVRYTYTTAKPTSKVSSTQNITPVLGLAWAY